MIKSRGERIFSVINLVFLSLVVFAMLYPFINVTAIAFNDGLDTSLGGITFYPRKPTLMNLKVALAYPNVGNAFLVSIGRTVLSTVYAVSIVTLAAFFFSKRGVPFKKLLFFYFMLPGFIPAGIVPSFLNITRLGLYNNFWVYVLPTGFSIYNMIIVRTYMEGIPESLTESANIDGATQFTIFSRIILPLSKPPIAAISLFVAVSEWNQWFDALLYVTNKKLYPLQLVLQKILKESMDREVLSTAETISQQMMNSSADPRGITATSIQMAVLIITIAPIIMVYPFLQKYFVKGVMIGAVKG